MSVLALILSVLFPNQSPGEAQVPHGEIFLSQVWESGDTSRRAHSPERVIDPFLFHWESGDAQSNPTVQDGGVFSGRP